MEKNSERNGAVPQGFDVVPEVGYGKPFVLDEVLTNELGQFGLFQLVTILLLAIPNIMTGFMADYIFVAAPIPHRCMVPECGENSKDMPFSQDWLSTAIPGNSGGLASCERFAPAGGNGTLDQCPAQLFNQGTTVECDGYVYARDNSVVYDFDLGCQEWQRTLPGTLNSVGTLLAGPITGFISDRFGRRVALIFNVLGLGVGGLLKAFSVNFPMYLAMQILQAAIGGGAFTAAYILATELVGPKYRVLTGVTCSAMFATGQVITGAIAWAVQPWRHLMLVLFSPCFIIIAYYWLVSESVRWLISKRKFDEAIKTLEKVARLNKRVISKKSLQALINPPPSPVTDNEGQSVISTILKSPVLRRRVCTTPIWWISTTFVYYGLSINSVSLSESIYLNVILTCAIEIPGFYTGVLLLDWIGRRLALSGGYFLSAACCIAFILIPIDLYVLRLIVYLLGKFAISLVMTTLYLYTSELYPTQYRHSLVAFSSMIGRIGAITAPLTPALMQYWSGIPSVMFAVMALLAGVLVLTQPETLGTRMPDTLAEAEALGRRNVPITTQL